MQENKYSRMGHPVSIEDFVGLFGTILRGRCAYYISVPITSGTRFHRWYKDEGSKIVHDRKRYAQEHYGNVIQHNLKWFIKRIEEIRKSVNNNIVIDPTVFEFRSWDQKQYRLFWAKVIEKYVHTIIFMDGWQFSSGCANEFLVGAISGISLLDENRQPIMVKAGLELMHEAIGGIHKYELPEEELENVVLELEIFAKHNQERGAENRVSKEENVFNRIYTVENERRHFKDTVLDQLANVANIAQFVSFEPNSTLKQRFCRLKGIKANYIFPSAQDAVSGLLVRSPDGTVNVRSFRPDQKKGEPLRYGLKSTEDVIKILRRNVRDGKYSIVNETVKKEDGGVSGVAIGNLLEFSPNDTPQCVDRPGVCALPRDIGLSVLSIVYGFRPSINFGRNVRVEFSIHPRKRGLREEHTIIWELEEIEPTEINVDIMWPNNFSKMLGDKAFGLLLGQAIGIRVPRSIIVNRSVAPFLFGAQTYTKEYWMRTCPEIPYPGKYTTTFGWQDPFRVLAEEESRFRSHKEMVQIASVMAQESVVPAYSGSLVPSRKKYENLIIEGVRGPGDKFMVGKASPEKLPNEVKKALYALHECASERLGAVEIEWVYNGQEAWLIQIHKARVKRSAKVIYQGKPVSYYRFDVKRGLEELRELIPTLKGHNEGVVLVGDVGITSHYGDILRSARIPSRIERIDQLELFKQDKNQGPIN